MHSISACGVWIYGIFDRVILWLLHVFYNEQSRDLLSFLCLLFMYNFFAVVLPPSQSGSTPLGIMKLWTVKACNVRIIYLSILRQFEISVIWIILKILTICCHLHCSLHWTPKIVGVRSQKWTAIFLSQKAWLKKRKYEKEKVQTSDLFLTWS